jgi:hypothetical protein
MPAFAVFRGLSQQRIKEYKKVLDRMRGRDYMYHSSFFAGVSTLLI